jgi:hypothetical protein
LKVEEKPNRKVVTTRQQIEVITAVVIKSRIFRDIVPYSPLAADVSEDTPLSS